MGEQGEEEIDWPENGYSVAVVRRVMERRDQKTIAVCVCVCEGGDKR